jgi:hypothetical protein
MAFEMSLPRIDIFIGREDFGLGILLLLQKSLQVQKLGRGDIVLEVGKPAVIQCINLQLQ